MVASRPLLDQETIHLGKMAQKRAPQAGSKMGISYKSSIPTTPCPSVSRSCVFPTLVFVPHRQINASDLPLPRSGRHFQLPCRLGVTRFLIWCVDPPAIGRFPTQETLCSVPQIELGLPTLGVGRLVVSYYPLLPASHPYPP